MSETNKNTKLHKTNIFKPLLLTAALMILILSIYIPYITDKNSIKTITEHSLNAVKQIKLTRAYYVDNVVKDIKEYAPNIKFSYQHQGVNGVIPLPTTVIHDLSGIFSDKTGIKYNLYSEFPFKNRADRNLTKFQKEALFYTQQNPDGVYVKRDTMNGEPVLRVAVTDFMTSQACVDCHNSHPDRTWELGKWKLGDKRGVLEVITPIQEELNANNMVKYSILALIAAMILLLLWYYSHIFIRRENELVHTIGSTKKALKQEKKISITNQALLEEYKKAIDLSAIVSKTTLDGTITYVNDEFCKTSQYSEDELIGQNHRILKHPDQDEAEYKKLWKTIFSKQVYRGTLKNLAKSGNTYYVDATIVPILDTEGEILEFLAIRYDVTNHIQAIIYAYTDTLTGISNRNKFEEVFAYELKQTLRYKNPLSLAIVDIDHFKKFNDEFGHLVGDEVLILLASTVKQHVRKTDLFARWGGEEFVLLFVNTNLENSLIALEKFRLIIEGMQHEKAGRITASFGVTEYKENDTLVSMLDRADKALYHAKTDGRNCIRSLK